MWDWIVNVLFQILALIQQFAVDWGLSIIILVVIIRLLLTPLMIKSSKSTARMQVLTPKIQEIQERYADDPQRQSQEMQKFYAENKFSPFGGCLPLLIQMPILCALFTLLQHLGDYFDGETFSFYGILPNLQTSVASGFWRCRTVCRRVAAFCRSDAYSAALYVSQPDGRSSSDHEDHGYHHVLLHVVHWLEPSCRCSSVLRCVLRLAGCPADLRYPEGYR